MNLILCEPHELRDDGIATLTGVRAAHVRDVLRAAPGDTLRVGVIDGGKGIAEILALDDETVTLRCDLTSPAPPRPPLDLLLALPRPKVLRRLWPQLAALGVGRILLTNAARVERHYFDTHVVAESTYRPLLIEGLQQAADTRLPRVSIHRQFRVLVEDELGSGTRDERRIVAHPGGGQPLAAMTPDPRQTPVLLAIGPEGGWNAFELDLLQRHDFVTASLGPRILRTDTACVALLALVHETLLRERPR